MTVFWTFFDYKRIKSIKEEYKQSIKLAIVK